MVDGEIELGDQSKDAEVRSGNVSSAEGAEPKSELQYGLEDIPPWYMWILLGFQHYLTMVGATISIPLILAPPLCIQDSKTGVADEVAKAELMGTLFFVSGIVTFLQTTFGCRLPIVQGGTFSLLPPTFAILQSFGDCPTVLSQDTNVTSFALGNPNVSFVVVGTDEHKETWQVRMRSIQGAIMVSALLQVVIGFSGIIGFLLRFIGPLVITPTIALVGLSLFHEAGNIASAHWGIAFLTIALMALFAEYLKNVKIPCCAFRRGKGCSRKEGYPLFRLFPVILAILVTYLFSIILTYTNGLPNDPKHFFSKARTDYRISVLNNAGWFRVPYPGQWGLPTVTVAGVFGMMAGIIASMIESIGDYYAAARLSGAPPPTTAAINRGIGMEGIGCILAGAWGSGNGTTSYSENIGAIGITQIASRRVIQAGGIIMILLGMITKFAAVFVTVPDPIVGGVYVVMFGMVMAVGLSNLQFVDLNSSRNLFILGLSIMLGLAVPDWMKSHPDHIQTGEPIVDDIIKVLLSTSMFIGGTVGFFLDNTIPGTAKERGLLTWTKESEGATQEETRELLKCYDMPFGNDAIYRAKWTRYIPICPNFLIQQKKNSIEGSVELTNIEISSHNNFENSAT